ncbi:MAG: aminoacyl-tRNA hydrolase [Bacteroidales bacterium]|nr:aminoacyl-tRNA hydrolase [Bacteroidales bacterium]
MIIDYSYLSKEIQFKASLSSGAGGQHVNKVSTKIRLIFNIEQSDLLSDHEKTIILDKLKNRININNELIIESQSTRSQFRNKQLAIEKFNELIAQALKRKKIRRVTKPTRSSKEKRLGIKRIQSEKKNNRKKPDA